MNADDPVFSRLAAIITDTFGVPRGVPITRSTTAMDIPGWDSLSHTMLILNVEESFGVELPVEEVEGLPDVGSLSDLIRRTI